MFKLHGFDFLIFRLEWYFHDQVILKFVHQDLITVRILSLYLPFLLINFYFYRRR